MLGSMPGIMLASCWGQAGAMLGVHNQSAVAWMKKRTKELAASHLATRETDRLQ